MPPAIIVIGGSDSSGGAGVSRDVVTLAGFGFKARPVLTAVTAQTDKAVTAVELIDPQLVVRQLRAAFDSGPVKAVKIGMLGTEATVTAIADTLASHKRAPVVVDPVIASSSGTRLLSAEGIEALKQHLLPLCDIVTPNLPEAKALIFGDKIGEACEIEAQANALLDHGVRHVLIKGGHDDGNEAADRLFSKEGGVRRFAAPRLSTEMRGTGCMLASAIAAHLANGLPVEAACMLSKDFLHQVLKGNVDWTH
ncbi:bifunctional hydroxymethylpyrimidine kinase/phosphomethylpyrimidine kinase [Oricola cellulosilytica]|uniref:hydroxymethylpyrimidine kinase n=1 Tax=Oricola cellulosilytica TaxID=1429082 RepID=A0A4R0PAT0_9HYPH|nr:bifunctional hydroxymethylpyrimidine kinase/phosphomethylpyrimidine kinase [Oricola cellulosilytica]TCD13330.1 bifunctional hydroxymethylpyrimidine kinase/phosphomethylpyrimidine kinase [Oricola cellulosilytica]